MVRGVPSDASAFREYAHGISAPTATAPQRWRHHVRPTGPSGVLSIELKAGQTVDEAKVVLASIVASQLATLTMPIPGAQPQFEEVAPEAHRAAI